MHLAAEQGQAAGPVHHGKRERAVEAQLDLVPVGREESRGGEGAMGVTETAEKRTGEREVACRLAAAPAGPLSGVPSSGAQQGPF